MRYRANLSKWDVIVVSMCLVLLMVTAGAVGPGGHRRAKEAVCLSNLHCWGNAFDAFVQDNNGHLISGESEGGGMWWIQPLRPYRGDARLLLCPEAMPRVSHAAWPDLASTPWQVDGVPGNYGVNGWICDPTSSLGVWGRWPASNYWRTPDVPGRNNIPVFADMWWVDAWPQMRDIPPHSSGAVPEIPGINEMQRVCIDRHNGAVGCLFMDWSARKVGLKELWTLKWHRTYNTAGLWTKAGGVMPTDWPQWMSRFKDF